MKKFLEPEIDLTLFDDTVILAVSNGDTDADGSDVEWNTPGGLGW